MKYMKNKKEKINKSDQGFSLVELIVVVALIGILTSIIITSANFSETQKNLTLAKNELQSAVRVAQSYSLSIPDEGVENICGFGIYVKDVNSYEIYYTFDDDPVNPPACSDAGLQDPAVASTSTRIQGGTFPAKSNVQFDPALSPPNSYIFFQAPYGDKGTGVDSLTLDKINGTSSPRTVTVTAQGKID